MRTHRAARTAPDRVWRGEPLRGSICRCHACHKRTCSVLARRPVAERTASPSGRFTEFVRRRRRGAAASAFRFCPDCGSTVYYDIDKCSGNYVGSHRSRRILALPHRRSPSTSAKRPWVELPEASRASRLSYHPRTLVGAHVLFRDPSYSPAHASIVQHPSIRRRCANREF